MGTNQASLLVMEKPDCNCATLQALPTTIPEIEIVGQTKSGLQVALYGFNLPTYSKPLAVKRLPEVIRADGDSLV